MRLSGDINHAAQVKLQKSILLFHGLSRLRAAHFVFGEPTSFTPPFIQCEFTRAGLLPALERMGKTATFLFQPTEVMVLQNDSHGTEGCFVKLELPAVLLLSLVPKRHGC